MAAGSIVVDLLMKTGSFETDTARAGKAMKKLQRDIDDAAKKIGVAFGAGVVGLALLVKSTIDAQDHLNDLSKKTGIAADTLGGIGFAAKQSGGDLDSAAAAAGKLNKSLAEAAAGSKEALDPFLKLGIAVKDAAGNTKNADVVLAELADKFAGYADGPEKAALALKIFGKAGADIIPLLNEGGQALQDQIAYFKRYSGVTVETAKKADEFNDTLVKINLLSGAFATTLTAELLPTLKALADAFLKAKEEGEGFTSIASTIGSVFKGLVIAGAYVIDTFGGMGREIGAIGAQLAALARLDFKEFNAISKAVTEDGERAKKELDAFVKNVLNPALADPKTTATPGIKPAAPRLSSGSSGADTAEAELRKKLDGVLRSIRNAADAQQSALAFSGRILEGEYQDQVISLGNFFEDQRSIRARALALQLEEQDKIIAAQEDFAKKSGSATAKLDADNKIADAREKKTRLIVEAGQAEQLALQQNARDVKALDQAFQSVNAQVLDLKENFRGAAEVKFDLQFDVLKRTFTAEGNKAGERAIAILREAAVAQADFLKASTELGRTFDALSAQEERLAIAQQLGALGTLQGLAAVGQARRDMIPLLEAQVAAEEAIAKASGNPNLIANANASRLALERLKAAADPLAESLNKAFGQDLNNALDDFVTGTKSASEAFKSFGKSVLDTILKLGTKSITESIFGGSGGLGGILSSLFSTGSGQGAGAGLVGAFSSLFSGFFAEGGFIPPGKVGVVGERGPELAFGGRGGQTILPAGAGGGGSHVTNISVSMPASATADRATALQRGREFGAGIRQAMARND